MHIAKQVLHLFSGTLVDVYDFNDINVHTFGKYTPRGVLLLLLRI